MADSVNTTAQSTDRSLSSSLLVRVRNHERDGWARLVHIYGPIVLQWSRRAGLSEADAEDVTQDVFRAVATSIESFRRKHASDTFRGWLCRITRFKVCDFWRRSEREFVAAGGTDANLALQQRSDQCFDEIESESASDASKDVIPRALTLIQTHFKERTWRAFWGTTVDERSVAEVANELCMSTGAVHVAKSRVLKRLREELVDLEEGI